MKSHAALLHPSQTDSPCCPGYPRRMPYLPVGHLAILFIRSTEDIAVLVFNSVLLSSGPKVQEQWSMPMPATWTRQRGITGHPL